MMQFADGGDLAAQIKLAARNRKLFNESKILHWFVQMALGLSPGKSAPRTSPKTRFETRETPYQEKRVGVTFRYVCGGLLNPNPNPPVPVPLLLPVPLPLPRLLWRVGGGICVFGMSLPICAAVRERERVRSLGARVFHSLVTVIL